MNNWIYLLLFASPFIGGLTSIKTGYKNENLLKLFTAFAGGFVFSVTLLDLLPHSLQEGTEYTPMFVLAGFLFQLLIGRFSEGAEHGHLHTHQHNHSMALPLGLFLSMCLHAFIEGLPVGISNRTSESSLGIGIALHELPAAFALISIIQSEHLKKQTVLALLFIYALMSPAGAFTGSILTEHLSDRLFSSVLAIVAGVFLFISTTIIFENSENHKLNKRKLVAVLFGIMLAVGISHFL